MRISQTGDLADKVIANVKSGEASATIPRGTPLVLVMNGTGDGLVVVLPSTAGSALSFNGRYGVNVRSMAPGDLGESIVFGYVQYALITRMTRAASTDSWTSSASIASGIGLGVDSLNNAFVMGVSRVGSLQSVADNAWLVDSLASSAATASSTADSRTAITNGARVFVRML